jgi:DNA mismatch repair ATPase MutS
MISLSILFQRDEDRERAEGAETPAFFRDLNLDQIIDAVTASKEEYDLKPFFYTSLQDADAIRYRHEVLQDLESATLFKYITSFAQKMREMRAHLTQVDKLSYKYQRQRWFLDAVSIYCQAVHCLAADLSLVTLKSRGLMAFRDYLKAYLESEAFTSLLAETQKLHADLATIKYCILIKGNGFKVRKYESESDYSSEVEETFAKFKQGAVKDYRAKLSDWLEMNHIEEKVLEYVALLYPDTFSSLDGYCQRSANYLDKTIRVFDREIQFYVAYLEQAEMFKRAGLQFCYPEISNLSKEVYSWESFDLALGYKLRRENSSVVCNDFYLKGKERIFVVSGPNQGGKTTFARAFGQLHYLASLGCPVPGREARLFLFDQLFTHFEMEEDIENLRGKLQDDLVRIHQILSQATSSSIVILNEAFTSTTLQDEIFLGKRVIEKISELDLLCVWVTFVDELASYSEEVVSMVSTVFPEDPTLRTFKILRRAADGLSYAMSIAEKYRLTHDQLKDRLKI